MTIRRRVTLKDIAQVAGVHHTTVSMALRNRPELPAATRERIRALAERMGYRVDPALLALRAYRRGSTETRSSMAIAFVTAFESPDFWRNIPVYARRYAGIERRAAQFGYRVEPFWFDRKNMSGKRASQILHARGVSGLIMAPLERLSSLGLEWNHFACVSLTLSIQEADMHVVGNNHMDTVRTAYARLRAAGYRRIGLVLERRSNERVLRVWSVGAAGEDVEVAPADRVPAYLPEALGRTGFDEWFRAHRPDAILTIPPHLEGILGWLRRAGMSVPGEVGVASLDCPEPDGEISGIYQNAELLGMTAVDVLAGLIHRNDLGLPEHPQLIQTRGTWVDGKTTRPANSNA